MVFQKNSVLILSALALISSLSGCNGTQIAIDNDTGLMWQDNVAAKTVTKYWITKEMNESKKYFDVSGDTASSYCEALSLEGYTDWRLPTENELGSIVDETKTNPSSKAFIKNVASSFYWTSTSDEESAGAITVYDAETGEDITEEELNLFAEYVEIVYFSDGKHGASEKYNLGNVRCVRSHAEPEKT